MKKFVMYTIMLVFALGFIPKDVEAAKVPAITKQQKAQLTDVEKKLAVFLTKQSAKMNLADKNSSFLTSKTANGVLKGKERKSFVNSYQKAKKIGLNVKNNTKMKNAYTKYANAIAYTEAAYQVLHYEENVPKSQLMTVKDAIAFGAVSLKNKTTLRAKAYKEYQDVIKLGETTKNSQRMKELNKTYGTATNYLKGILELEKFSKIAIEATDTEATIQNKGSKVTAYIAKINNDELLSLLEAAYKQVLAEKTNQLPPPIGSYQAFYYPNATWSGEPTSSSIVNANGNQNGFSVNYGNHSPSQTIPQTNNFSVIYKGVVELQEGQHIFRAYGDDAIQVVLDGQVIIDNVKTSNAREIAKAITVIKKEKNLHSIEVRQADYSGNSELAFSINPYEDNLPVDGKWMAEIYPNGKYLEESPFIFGGIYGKETSKSSKLKGPKITNSYSSNAPNSLFDIPETITKDNWAVALSQKSNFTGSDVIFTLRIDPTDAVRIYVDKQLKFDSKKYPGTSVFTPSIKITQGVHEISIVHFDGTGSAMLNAMYTDAPATSKDYMLLDLNKPSNVTAAEISRYILGKYPDSPLAAYSQYFIDVEKEYAINGLYLAAQAILESSYGRSEIAYRKHNLFGYGAVDTDPFNGAYYFTSYKESIQNQGYSIQFKYFEPTNFRYHGTNLAGIGMYYATDSIYAKKIAAIMQSIKPYDAAYYNSTTANKPILTTAPVNMTKEIPYTKINSEMELPTNVTLYTIPYPFTDRNSKALLKENGAIVVLPALTKVTVYRQDPNGWYEILYKSKKVWAKW